MARVRRWFQNLSPQEKRKTISVLDLELMELLKKVRVGERERRDGWLDFLGFLISLLTIHSFENEDV